MSLTQAQSVLALDPSIRASGTGSAGTAVFWGPDPDYWRNPALLAYQRGVRCERGKTRLVPDVTDGVYFTSDRLTFAAFGFGLSLEGRPLDALGGRFLDYGTTAAVDGEGNSLGDSWEDVQQSWGLTVSAVQVLDSVLDSTGEGRDGFRRFGDISLGARWNTVDVHLAPDRAMGIVGIDEAARAEAHTRDWGYLVRLSPYNSVDYEGWLPALDEVLKPIMGGFAVETAYGEGTQNDREDTIRFLSTGPVDPIPMCERRGHSLRVAAGFPGILSEILESYGLGFLAKSLSPLLSVGWAWDRAVHSRRYPESGIRLSWAEEEYSGWELTVVNLFTLRRGRVDDRDRRIHGDTSGWGLGCRVGEYGGLRYDEATVPRELDLSDVERRGFTIFVDPSTIWRDVRR